MNSNPAISPQRIDCGFAKTVFNDPRMLAAPPGPLAIVPSCFGRSTSKVTLIASPTNPA